LLKLSEWVDSWVERVESSIYWVCGWGKWNLEKRKISQRSGMQQKRGSIANNIGSGDLSLTNRWRIVANNSGLFFFVWIMLSQSALCE
jgi:hypothetical protein